MGLRISGMARGSNMAWFEASRQRLLKGSGKILVFFEDHNETRRFRTILRLLLTELEIRRSIICLSKRQNHRHVFVFLLMHGEQRARVLLLLYSFKLPCVDLCWGRFYSWIWICLNLRKRKLLLTYRAIALPLVLCHKLALKISDLKSRVFGVNFPFHSTTLFLFLSSYYCDFKVNWGLKIEPQRAQFLI